MSDRDLVVVGGGPAGLATAIRGRMAGLSVAVLDGSRPPIDRPCGEGVMPEGVAQLEALGVQMHGDERAALPGDSVPSTATRSPRACSTAGRASASAGRCSTVRSPTGRRRSAPTCCGEPRPAA